MTSPKHFAISLAFLIVLPLAAAQAQTPQVSTVNVSPEAGKVRISGVGEVFDLKLEVVDESGETVFEGAQVSDRPLDWDMTDARGVRVAPGTYTVTVSYTTRAGKARKRIEQVLVTEEMTNTGGAEKTGGQPTSAAPSDSPTPLLDGSGAANRIPKYVDADTLTSSSIMDVSGRIGIGTVAAPAAGLRLEINGLTKMTPGGTGGYMQFGTPNGETGFGWIKGTASRADVRFNGTSLTLAAGAGINVPPPTNGIVITTAGRVGIGTGAPAHKLEVNSPGYAVVGRSSGAGAGLYGESAGFNGVRGVGRNVNHGAVVGVHEAGGIGVYGTSGGTGVFGESTGGTGVHGKSASKWGVLGQSASSIGVLGRSSSTTTAGAGVSGINDAGGWAMFAGGHAGQARDRGGWVKAMIYVNIDGTMGRCFNSQMPDGGASLPPSGSTGCGFKVRRAEVFDTDDDAYIVTFPFPVKDRFYSLTAKPALYFPVVNVGANFLLTGTQYEIEIRTYLADGPGDELKDSAFMLIVF